MSTPTITQDLTTWLGCYIVSQMQASRHGAPNLVHEGFSLVSSYDHRSVHPTLSQLCQIIWLAGHSANTIGANAQNISGLLNPIPRINVIKLFDAQFDRLHQDSLSSQHYIIELAFLSSRLQLWSFAFHSDIPPSFRDVIEIVNQAEQDAIHLVQVACEKNLALVPFYICRSVCYS